MTEYKQSFYNINLVEDGYVRGTNEGITPYYNIRTGKFGYIPDDVDFNNPPQDLLQKGFIIPSNIDEQESYRQAQINAITDDYPSKVKLTLATTMKCNYRCKYCFEDCNNGVDMTSDVLQNILKYIKKEIDRNDNLKTLVITFFGGEPLYSKGLQTIQKVSEFVIPYCESRNIVYSGTIVTSLKEVYLNNIKMIICRGYRITHNGELDSGIITLLIYYGICPGNKDEEANAYWEKYLTRIKLR